MGLKIAIQGQAASFHDIAARKFFGDDIDIVPCDTFALTMDALHQTDHAVLAIENSLYGSINEVYDLLLKQTCWVEGEVYVRVSQCLIGFESAGLKTIQEVHSHPVALAQCEVFLDKYLPHAKRFEHHDTAGSVADVKKWTDPRRAAIASSAAAKLHGLQVLADEIETNKQSYTRFIALSKQEQSTTSANKTSLVLTTHSDTKPGALYRALGVFAKRDINLTMLQSRPVIGKTWHYQFYVDMSVGIQQPTMQQALKDLKALGYGVQILGSYKSGMS